jgi:hypothetical protein
MILQMLIGILCQVINETTQREKYQRDMHQLREHLVSMLKEQDKDSDARFSQAELTEMIQGPSSRNALENMQINIVFMMHLVHTLLPTPDSTASMEDVINALMACRSNQTATVATCAGGFNSLSRQMRFLHDEMRSMGRTKELVSQNKPQGGN